MKLLNLSCYIKMLYFTVALIGLISTILSCVKNSRKYKISLKICPTVMLDDNNLRMKKSMIET